MTLAAAMVAVLAFLAGGFIKGIVGIGLPMVALPILVSAFPVSTAVALTMMPILVTNAWQALGQGSPWPVLRRHWLLLLSLLAVALPATRFLSEGDDSVLRVLAGSALILSAAGLAVARHWALPPRFEKLASVIAGMMAGFLGGVSSLFGVPVIVYLTSLKLSREDFVGTISLIYLIAVVPFSASLAVQGVFGWTEFALSALCVMPAMIGAQIGSMILKDADGTRFRGFLLWVLAVMGAWMILQVSLG